jgi:hypothetical protein
MGCQTLVVIPWRVGGTLWKIDMWHGKVTDGITDWAWKLQAPRWHRPCKVRQSAATIASGRRPSIMTKITGVSLAVIALPFS